MRIDRQVSDLPQAACGGAIAIGNFDGVHRGHAKLIERLVARSKEVDGPAIVFTFDPHPVRLLRPEHCPPPLTWTERKGELLHRLGVDRLIAYPTDDALLRLSAREFFDLIVRDTLKAKAIVEGPNFFFGRNREGNTELLGQFAREAGMTLDVVIPSESEGEMISSSRIRKLLSNSGDVDQARQLLTAPYRLRGLVTHGARRGTKLGFPTANLEGVDTLLPADGVYAGVARTGSPASLSRSCAAAIHIGPNPTFGEDARKIEAHLLGHDGPLYGRPLEIDFLSRLRDVTSFDSPEALVAQVEQDIAQTRAIAAEYL